MSEAPALHPLLERISELLVQGTDEPWSFAPGAEATIAGLLRAMNGKPELADGVLSLFHAAIALSEEEGSPKAAAVVFRALHTVKHELSYAGQKDLDRQLEAALDHTPKRAPRVGEKAPEGSIKAARLAPPPKRLKP